MWNKIINPCTKKNIYLNSNEGQFIVHKYYNKIGGVNNNIDIYKPYDNYKNINKKTPINRGLFIFKKYYNNTGLSKNYNIIDTINQSFTHIEKKNYDLYLNLYILTKNLTLLNKNISLKSQINNLDKTMFLFGYPDHKIMYILNRFISLNFIRCGISNNYEFYDNENDISKEDFISDDKIDIETKQVELFFKFLEFKDKIDFKNIKNPSVDHIKTKYITSIKQKKKTGRFTNIWPSVQKYLPEFKSFISLSLEIGIYKLNINNNENNNIFITLYGKIDEIYVKRVLLMGFMFNQLGYNFNIIDKNNHELFPILTSLDNYNFTTNYKRNINFIHSIEYYNSIRFIPFKLTTINFENYNCEEGLVDPHTKMFGYLKYNYDFSKKYNLFEYLENCIISYIQGSRLFKFNNNYLINKNIILINDYNNIKNIDTLKFIALILDQRNNVKKQNSKLLYLNNRYLNVLRSFLVPSPANFKNYLDYSLGNLITWNDSDCQ